jgi:hypothetical protein
VIAVVTRAAFAFSVFIMALVGLGPGVAQPTPSATSPGDLRPVSGFTDIADARMRAIALFEEAGKVFRSPRCLNCHPAGEQPSQGDRMRRHQPLVVRGADGHGAPGLLCSSCHGGENFHPAGVPGNTHWGLAPASMALQGRSLGQICEQIKDPARNGSRDLAALLEHVVTDSLIVWAWSPGPGRTPPPGTNAGFVALLQAWIDAGAHCPPS